jgi:hypothetical protein
MKIASFLTILGVIAVVFGLSFTLAPELSLKQYGTPTDPHHVLLARYFGSTLLAFGLVPLLGRNVRDDAALRVILQAGAVGNAIGLALSAWAATSGLQNAMAWSSVLIYGILLLGQIYYLSSQSRRA